MAIHAFNPSTWEQTGRSQSLLPASIAKSHSFSFRERPCLKSIRPKVIKEVTSYLHLPLALASTWTRAYPHTYVHALYTHTCTHVCSSTLCSSLSHRNTCELLMSGTEQDAPPMDSISTSGAADRHSVVDLCALQSHAIANE